MSGCYLPNDVVPMPVCEHLVPVKFPCSECKRGDASPMVEQIQKLTEKVSELEAKLHREGKLDG